MTRRINTPRLCRVYGTSVADSSASARVSDHAAPTATDDTKFRLLDLKLELRRKIYDAVANGIETLGLNHTGGLATCREPFALACKQIRKEFLSHLQKHSLPAIRVYVARVKDLDFRRLISLLRNHVRSNHLVSSPVRVKVYHILETEDIDGERLGKWQKFVAQHSGLDVKHTISQALATDETKGQLNYPVVTDADSPDDDTTEIGKIRSAIQIWCCLHPNQFHTVNTARQNLDGEDGDFEVDEDMSSEDDDMMSTSSDEGESEPELDEAK